MSIIKIIATLLFTMKNKQLANTCFKAVSNIQKRGRRYVWPIGQQLSLTLKEDHYISIIFLIISS